MERHPRKWFFRDHQEVVIMAMYLGSKKVAVTNTVEKQVPSMKAFFEAGGKCAQSTATSFDGCWQFDDTVNVTNMHNMFYNCSSISTIPLFDTSKVTDMNRMFSNCMMLQSLDLSNWDLTNVTNMSGMFSGDGMLRTITMKNCSTETVNKIKSVVTPMVKIITE